MNKDFILPVSRKSIILHNNKKPSKTKRRILVYEQEDSYPCPRADRPVIRRYRLPLLKPEQAEESESGDAGTG
jgi:hypothetical protein